MRTVKCRSLSSPALVLLLFLSTLPISRGYGQELDAPVPPWKDLLQRVEHTRESAQLPAKRWRGGGKHSLALFNRLWDDWTQLRPHALATARTLRDAGGFEVLLLAAAEQLGNVPPETEPGAKDALADSASARLVDAIAGLHDVAEKPLTDEQLGALKAAAREVPAEVAQAASLILEAVPGARSSWQAGSGLPEDSEERAKVKQEVVRFGTSYRVNPRVLKVLDNIDFARLLSGARTLAAQVDSVRADADTLVSDKQFRFSWSTPWGTVALRDKRPDRYEAASYLLIIDTGGNDQYLAPAKAAPGVALTVVLDLAGDDRYESSSRSVWGAGIGGYGLLWDRAGDDRYQQKFFGPGTGMYGVGICIDSGGNDIHDVQAYGQGAACLGVGILADNAGDDVYKGYRSMQGYGGTYGCGMLLDRTGNDRYLGNTEDIKYPSAQGKGKYNTTLGQGAGFGRRAHPGDQKSLGGGVGCLVDLAGDDLYRCGVFGQATAYWYSIGMLVDAGGDDSYDGAWYVQGNAVHYATAVMLELGGNDTYRASATQNQGHAKDHSTALLYEAAGDDSYANSAWALGTGLWTAIGLFWDGAGNDAYDPKIHNTVGATKGGESVGVFADTGGANRWSKKAASLEKQLVPLAGGKGQIRVTKSK